MNRCREAMLVGNQFPTPMPTFVGYSARGCPVDLDRWRLTVHAGKYECTPGGLRPSLDRTPRSHRIHVDHGLTGTNRDRPGLRLALAACRSGDTFVVTKLDRLARSLPDARDILAELTAKNVRLSMGGSVRDPADPVGRLLFNVLAMVAEFESDLIRSRTREGMQVAKAKGHLRGKQPKLTANQAKHLVELADLNTYSSAELAELFGVGRSTVYRTLPRVRPMPADPNRPFASEQA